jgi:ribosomal protein S18 acetylase RimI-like enzyme
MAEKETVIREAQPADLNAIARLYRDYMYDSYLVRLGDVFLRGYLGALLASPHCLTLVAEREGVEGFITACFDCKGLLPGLLRDTRMLGAIARGIGSRPFAAASCFGLVLYPFCSRLPDVDSELLFIAVEPGSRKEGTGGRLIVDALSKMKGKGAAIVKVSTCCANTAVNSLLERSGFRHERNFTLLGKRMSLHSYGR